jgi:hypothetical protein
MGLIHQLSALQPEQTFLYWQQLTTQRICACVLPGGIIETFNLPVLGYGRLHSVASSGNRFF